MVERLKRLVPGQISTVLLVKAVIFGLLLLYVQSRDFALLPAFIFVAAAFVMYMQPLFRTFSVLVSWTALVSLCLFVTSQFAIAFRETVFAAHLPTGMVLFSIFFGFLFYLLLGIKNMMFLRRKQWYYVLNLAVLYLGFGLFFNAGSGVSFVLKSLGLFFFVALLVREFFKFHEQENSRLRAVAILIAAFVIMQFAWAITLLPIGFSSSASLLVALSFILTEYIQRYLQGDLSARFIRLNLLFLLTLICVIFFSSTWRL